MRNASNENRRRQSMEDCFISLIGLLVLLVAGYATGSFVIFVCLVKPWISQYNKILPKPILLQPLNKAQVESVIQLLFGQSSKGTVQPNTL